MPQLRFHFILLSFLVVIHLSARESGKLNNGLEYHLLHNETPQRRASLWLVLKVGMMHEKESQQGFAHFVEHLVWRGTENINEQQLAEKFELLDITEEPAHISSVTGNDATMIRMNIALDHPHALEQALFLLKEISTSAALLPEMVCEEKEEVLKELTNRVKDPVVEKLEQQATVLLGRPIKFFPQEMINNVQNASVQQLKEFYHSKYRPDQMALIVVGDFNEKIVKKRIEELFESLLNPPASATDRNLDEEQTISMPARVSFLLHENEKFALPKVSIAYLLPRKLESNIQQMLRPLIENRLQGLVDQGIMLSIWSSQTVLSSSYQLLEVGAVLFDEVSFLNVAGKFIEAVDQIEQAGFTEQEWRSLQDQMEELEPIENEIYASTFADQFLGHLFSKPLKIFPDNQMLEGSISNYGNVLRRCPKVIIVAVRSKEVLGR